MDIGCSDKTQEPTFTLSCTRGMDLMRGVGLPAKGGGQNSSKTTSADRYITRNMHLLNRQKEYVAQRILSASPIELIRMLYDGAVQAMDEAVAALRSGDIHARGQAVTKAVEILSELRASLRRDVQEEYWNTLGELYGYMQRQLIRAHAEQSESLLLEVSRLQNTLLEGWAGAMDKLASAHSPAPQESFEAAEVLSVSNPYSAVPASSRVESRSWQL
jgi:flagellar secretion chaperone FliS